MTQMIGWSFQVLNKEQFKEYQELNLAEKYNELKRLDLTESKIEGLKNAEFETLEKIVDADEEFLLNF